jgi:2-C-methyl-D-erythritol 4-phosphate cytidylyltransferase
MQEKCAVVIVAAGSSQRMVVYDKLWIPLAGRITLARTIDVFEESPLIENIVLVVNAGHFTDTSELCEREGWSKILGIVKGGPRRQDSVRAGLETLAEFAPGTNWVMIHDGARPLVSSQMLAVGLAAAQRYQAAIAAVPLKDTVKQIEGEWVSATIDRSCLKAIQTPQVFSFPLIYDAHASEIAREDVTDDATLLERLGHSVAIFPGSYTNIKITTPEDVFIVEALLQGSFMP